MLPAARPTTAGGSAGQPPMPRFGPETAPAGRERPRRLSAPAAKLAEPGVDGPQRVRLALAPARVRVGIFLRGLALEGHAHRVGSRGVQGQNLLQGDLVLPAHTEVILVADRDLAAEGITDPDVLFLPGLLQAEGRIAVVTAANPERVQVIAIPPEHDLDHPVQVTERSKRRYDDAAPDRRLEVLQLNLQ